MEGQQTDNRKKLKTLILDTQGTQTNISFALFPRTSPLFLLRLTPLCRFLFLSKLHRFVVLEISGNVVGGERASHAHNFFALIADEMLYTGGQIDCVSLLHGKGFFPDFNFSFSR